MYKKILVADYIQHGRDIIGALRNARFPITEAFWYDFPELDEWRLILASPIVHVMGPLEAYTLLNRVLSEIGNPLSVSDISLFSPVSSEYRALRIAALGPGRLRAGPATGRRKQDISFNDAYLYSLPSLVHAR
ncbi:MAG: hypothetical protein ABIZ80_03770 [Bryobacteraceae bacterium]